MLNVFLWCLVLVLFAPLLVLVAAPLIFRTGKWFVRAWDFPRLQLAALNVLPAIPATILIARDSYPIAAWIVLACLAGMVASALVQLAPFTRLWRKEVDGVDPKEGGDGVTIMVANICYESDQHENMARAIEQAGPDVLLLIELDQPWRDALADLAAQFPHRVEDIAGEGLGLALWSKLELSDTKVEHIVSDRRPSIFADVAVSDDRNMRFVGLHPTPPGLKDSTGEDRRDSRVRDGELVLLARHVAEHPHRNWVVAGDFNDVAWSHTTRLFKRLSGLLDPRVGRRLLNTYHAGYPLLRYPVDHLFVAPGFRMGVLERVRLPGSDHFGVVGRLYLEALAEAEPADPQGDADDSQEAKEAVHEGIQDAQERSVVTAQPGVSVAGGP
jgi:endonuclease/exonuclease/phosphatase (EEP) superfamily protein YafD